MADNKKIVVVVVAYNAVSTLERLLARIPADVADLVTEICVFDDASQDATYEVGLAYRKATGLTKLKIYRNNTNQGYGGNQKLAYRYAISKGYDVAVLLHGDGQYAPEVMMRLVSPLLNDSADAVMGSRMMEKGSALKGGMPLYKYVGNRILSTFQNLVLNQNLTEYHCGYRAYSLNALKQVPFERNTDDFHFDTQILVQLMAGGFRILEVPIPTYYGEEICYVDGVRYARDVALSVLDYRLHTLGLRQTPEYQLPARVPYPPRLAPYHSHERILARIRPGSTVLDVGCGRGHIAARLAEKGCVVDGLDAEPGELARQVCRSCIQTDLDGSWGSDELDPEGYDHLILADVLEHLEKPERLLTRLRPFLKPSGRLVATTGNVAHWFIRLQLLAGTFRYTPRGILDRTHLRLYTRETFLKLLNDAGYAVRDTDVTVVPIEELYAGLADSKAAGIFQKLYYRTARAWPGLMAYQVLAEADKAPDPLEDILKQEQNGD